MSTRLARLRTALQKAGLDGALVWQKANVRYLSGFTGTEGTLLITDREAYFLTDSRYTEQAGQQVTPHGFTVVVFTKKFPDIGARVAGLGIGRLGFEDEAMSVAEHRQIAQAVGNVALAPLGRLVTRLRETKDADEIAAIRRAVAIQEEAMEKTLPLIRPGAVERDIAFALEMEMRRLGATGVSFDTIVGSGPRGAMPHGVAADRVVEAGDLVVLDWGCFVDGYCSDQTLTVAVGAPSDPDAEKVYEVVRRAQRACIDAVRPGADLRALDALPRAVIAEAGYSEYFGHGTGHSLGLEIHEEPRVSPLGKGTAEIGMVFTVEPGIYLPGRFGVRLEDIVTVTKTGCDVLTTMSKSWRSTV